MQVYRIYQLSLYKKPLQAYIFDCTKAMASNITELVCRLNKCRITRSPLLYSGIPQQIKTRHTLFFQNKNTTI